MAVFFPQPCDKKLSCLTAPPPPPPPSPPHLFCEEGHGHPRVQNELSDTVLVHSQGK